MKKLNILLTALFLCFVAAAFADDDHESREIVIQLAPGVSIQTINARYGTTTEEILLNGTVYLVKVSDEDKLDSTIAAMKNDPDILAVDFNYFGEAPEAFRRTLAVVDTSPTLSKYRDQDAYKRVRAPQAQTLSTGAGVVVAVIDTGVDYRHPALAGHILRDSKNKVIGYDFVQNDRDPMDSANGLDDDHDGLVDEGAGHGTHVSGIISLVAPAAKILPLRVLNSDGVGTSDSVARAIEYALEYQKDRKTAMVINLSLGFPTQSFVVQEAIQEATEEGIPVVASAGNDNSTPHYPAAYPAAISVAAIGPNGVKAGFSNFGKGRVDFSAPGIGIYSTFLKGGYAWWDGTSMAAPFVSGEAALVMSMMPVHDSDDHPGTNVMTHMKKGVDSIYEVNPKFRQGSQLGYGSVDLYSTLLQMRGADRLTVQKAVYTASGRTLSLAVKSSKAPAAKLTAAGIGPMKFDPSTSTYTINSTVSSAPTSVTVTSSGGGIITAYVGHH